MKAPSFAFYTNNWLGSARINAMTPAEEGAYIRLLAYAWNSENCDLPNDDSSLALLSRLNENWTTSGPKLRDCFKEIDGRLVSERLLHCRKKADEYRRRRSECGRRGGRGHKKEDEVVDAQTDRHRSTETDDVPF